MRKLLVLLVSLSVLTMAGAAWANPALPRAEAPVYITSFGQSPDSNFVNLLSGRINLDRRHAPLGTINDTYWNSARTLIAVLGGSGKGLGAAGVDVASELGRCDSLIASARENNKFIIGVHIGGEDRRGPASETFIPYAGMVDFMIVRADGNRDGYFTRLCEEKGIPLLIVENTRELEGILREIFGL